MSTPTDQRRPARVISKASAGADHSEHETVNIVSVKPTDPHHAIKEQVQLTAAQTTAGVQETLIDSGGTVKGLRTIYINGYTGPS